MASDIPTWYALAREQLAPAAKKRNLS
jgi:hypothetical protein